jgi:hypothetical protein
VCSFCPAGHVLTPRLSPATACLLRQGGNRPRSGGPGPRDRSGRPHRDPGGAGQGPERVPGGLDQNCSPVAVRRPQTSPPQRRPVGSSDAACRYPSEYALASQVRHPGNVYLREADLLPAIDSWLPLIFAPHRLDQTLSGAATSVLSHRGTRRPGVAERHCAAVRAIGPAHASRASWTPNGTTHPPKGEASPARRQQDSHRVPCP